jgi:hypothetical protein
MKDMRCAIIPAIKSPSRETGRRHRFICVSLPIGGDTKTYEGMDCSAQMTAASGIEHGEVTAAASHDRAVAFQPTRAETGPSRAMLLFRDWSLIR